MVSISTAAGRVLYNGVKQKLNSAERTKLAHDLNVLRRAVLVDARASIDASINRLDHAVIDYWRGDNIFKEEEALID